MSDRVRAEGVRRTQLSATVRAMARAGAGLSPYTALFVVDRGIPRSAGRQQHATSEGTSDMMKNTVRGILGLVLAAAATWLANFVVEKVFGPDEPEPAKS